MLSGKFKHPWRESVCCSFTELEMLILKPNKRNCSALIMKIEAEEVKTKQEGLDLNTLLISGEKRSTPTNMMRSMKMTFFLKCFIFVNICQSTSALE